METALGGTERKTGTVSVACIILFQDELVRICESTEHKQVPGRATKGLSLIHISEPTRLDVI
eukprot:4183986-Prorocentrum_lima.AAC.1